MGLGDLRILMYFNWKSLIILSSREITKSPSVFTIVKIKHITCQSIKNYF